MMKPVHYAYAPGKIDAEGYFVVFEVKSFGLRTVMPPAQARAVAKAFLDAAEKAEKHQPETNA